MNNSLRTRSQVTLSGLLLGGVGLSLHPGTAYADATVPLEPSSQGSDPPIAAEAAILVETVTEVTPAIAPTNAEPDWSDTVPLVPPTSADTPAIAVDLVSPVAAPEVITLEQVQLEDSTLGTVSSEPPPEPDLPAFGAPPPPSEPTTPSDATSSDATDSAAADSAAVVPAPEFAVPAPEFSAPEFTTPESAESSVAPDLDAIPPDSSESKPVESDASEPDTVDLDSSESGDAAPEFIVPAAAESPEPEASAPATTPSAFTSPELSDPDANVSGMTETNPSTPVSAKRKAPIARSPLSPGDIAAPEFSQPEAVPTTLSQAGFDFSPIELDQDDLEEPLRLPPTQIEVPTETIDSVDPLDALPNLGDQPSDVPATPNPAGEVSPEDRSTADDSDATESGEAEPDVADPGAIEPDSTQSDVSESDSTESDADAEAIESEVPESDAVESNPTDLEAETEADGAEADSTEPDLIESEAADIEVPATTETTATEVDPTAIDPASPDAAWEALTVEQRREIQRIVILDALSSGNDRYPNIIDPTDNYTFDEELYRPRTEENYGAIDFRFNQDNPVLDKLTYGHYPEADQFYWVLPGNRVVLETEGWVGGIRYQGRTQTLTRSEEVTQSISLWGLQAVWNIPRLLEDPNDLDNLALALQDLQRSDIFAIAGQVVSDSGTIGTVTLDSGIDLNDPNTVELTEFLNTTPSLSEVETYTSSGGRDLFEDLADPRTPLILQAFPTNDLSGLAMDGQLREGAILSPEAVAAAGIQFANVLTGEPAAVALQTTSTPGVKFARIGEFDNLDLLNVLVNPDVEGAERDRRYLNSLYWTGFLRAPEFETLSESSSTEDWYQFYISHPHNRAMIAYDPVELKAEYTDIFANPGVGLTFSFEGEVDGGQSLNNTVGLALGGLFEPADHNDLEDYLDEARYRYEQGDRFAELQTVATPAQRQAINRRLNRTLSFATFNSGIEQLSGRITLESEITPDDSTALQLRTGLHQRRAQVIGLDQDLIEGDIEVTEVNLDSETFGPLTFTANPTTEDRLPGTRAEAFASEVVLITPSGRRLVQRYSSADQTSTPLGVNSADLAFDRIELTRIDQLDSSLAAYQGLLNVPAVELSRTGSDGIWNFSVNTGVWVNLDDDAAPGVDNNRLGNEEPGMGMYFNVFANAIDNEVRLDKKQRPLAVMTFGPTWRSQIDTTGDINAVLSYEYAEQRRDRGWSLRPGIAYVNDNVDDSQFIGFLSGRLSTASDWTFRSSLELQDDIFVNFTAVKRLDDRWSVGGYVRNYFIESTGLQERELGFNTGMTVRYTFDRSNSFLEGRLGGGDNGLDIQVQGGFRF